MRRRWRVEVFVLAVLIGSPALARLEAGRTLRGLEEVGVVVANLHPDAERRGLSQAMLQTDIEAQLQEAGIRVPAADSRSDAAQQPLLYLNVNITPLESFPAYHANLTLQLRQAVCLERNLIMCATAVTWEDAGVVRVVSVSHLASLRQDVREMVDRFIAAYSAENPKP